MATTEQTIMMMKKAAKKRVTEEQAAIDFDEVYRANVKRVFAFIAYRIEGRQAAEDVTAQVFEKAWRSRDGFNPDRASVTSWLFAIARNCAIDHLRRRQRNRETPLDSDLLAAATGDPEQELSRRQLRQELRGALEHLEEREREIIAMKFGGGMSNGDIAAVLSLTPTNISTILYRSLTKLNANLEGGINND